MDEDQTGCQPGNPACNPSIKSPLSLLSLSNCILCHVFVFVILFKLFIAWQCSTVYLGRGACILFQKGTSAYWIWSDGMELKQLHVCGDLR
jgi:hypothetical protein